MSSCQVDAGHLTLDSKLLRKESHAATEEARHGVVEDLSDDGGYTGGTQGDSTVDFSWQSMVQDIME